MVNTYLLDSIYKTKKKKIAERFAYSHPLLRINRSEFPSIQANFAILFRKACFEDG